MKGNHVSLQLPFDYDNALRGTRYLYFGAHLCRDRHSLTLREA